MIKEKYGWIYDIQVEPHEAVIGETGCCESQMSEQKTLMDRTVQLRD